MRYRVQKAAKNDNQNLDHTSQFANQIKEIENFSFMENLFRRKEKRNCEKCAWLDINMILVRYLLSKLVKYPFVGWAVDPHEVVHGLDSMELEILVYHQICSWIQQPRRKLIYYFISGPDPIVFCEIDAFLLAPGIHCQILDPSMNITVFLAFLLFGSSILLVQLPLVTFFDKEIEILADH